MPSASQGQAERTRIGYGLCWEDADILLAGLDPRPGHVCLTIASAGDNTLSLLARAPARVVAVDHNPAQLACLELRAAAYRSLDHDGLLELVGSRPSSRRRDLYAACRPELSQTVRVFWDARPEAVGRGIANAGRLERYLSAFRRLVLPLAHPRARVERLLQGGTREEREAFYAQRWNTLRWRIASRAFFSRLVMARLGRDPRHFDHAEADLVALLERRARHAVTALDPCDNPYLHWILRGRHGEALPFALRPGNFAAIRDNLDRLELRCQSLADYLASRDAAAIDRANLSDVFEYLSLPGYHRLLERLALACRPGARLAYWNLLAPRTRPAAMAERLRPLDRLSQALHARDKAFFYSAFVVEEAAG